MLTTYKKNYSIFLQNENNEQMGYYFQSIDQTTFYAFCYNKYLNGYIMAKVSFTTAIDAHNYIVYQYVEKYGDKK